MNKIKLPPILEPCTNVAQFDAWLQAYLGYTLPHMAVCHDHISPLEAFWLIASEQVSDAFLLANRSGTKTLGLSALITYKMVTHPEYQVVVVAGSKAQANEITRNITNLFLPRIMALFPNIFNQKTVKVSAERIHLRSSYLQVRAASLKGTNAPHPHMTVLDEIECFDNWSIIEEALSMAMDDPKHGYKGQNIFSSSRKFRFGIAQKLLEEAEYRNLKILQWCLFETMKEVPECPNCPDCAQTKRADGMSFKDLCRGRGAWSKGYIEKEHILREFLRLSPSVFDAQWLGLRPSPVGLVFPDFSKEQTLQAWQYRPEYPTIAGMDFGFQDPTVVLFCQQVDDSFVVFKEFIKRQEELTKFLNELVFYNNLYHVNIWWCDPSRPDLIAMLQNANIPAHPAPSIPKVERIDHIRQLLNLGKLRIDDSCQKLISEIQSYHYETDRRTLEPTEKLSDGNDDAIDALTYLIGGALSGDLSFSIGYPKRNEGFISFPTHLSSINPLSPADAIWDTVRKLRERGGLL